MYNEGFVKKLRELREVTVEGEKYDVHTSHKKGYVTVTIRTRCYSPKELEKVKEEIIKRLEIIVRKCDRDLELVDDIYYTEVGNEYKIEFMML